MENADLTKKMEHYQLKHDQLSIYKNRKSNYKIWWY